MGISQKKIREKTEDILRWAKINEPAVPVEKIAEQLNLQIIYEPFEGTLSGCVIREDGKARIGVNSNDHENRQRFTIAHEIGHFLLHEGEEVFVDHGFRINRRDVNSSLVQEPEEIEANDFAAELLMPVKFIKRDIEEKQIDLENDKTVQALAKKYKVSVRAFSYRLANLGYILA
ncbi:MAG: ImmA/IrrE family metallo-endopeptidase [Candidatus Omnitrophica bacterium]|nr:ImmA/IrrE family metallo-endopeptidase [Candidatus Omnitrophota bacterium]